MIGQHNKSACDQVKTTIAVAFITPSIEDQSIDSLKCILTLGEEIVVDIVFDTKSATGPSE